MPLGMEVGLSPGHIVLDGDPAHPPPQEGGTTLSFWPMSIVTKRLGGPKRHLVGRKASAQATLCYMGIQLPQKGHSPQFRPMYIVAKRSPISATAEHLFWICYMRLLVSE